MSLEWHRRVAEKRGGVRGENGLEWNTMRYPIATFAYMGVLYYLSSLPQERLAPVWWVPDGLLHALGYAGLALLLYLTLRRTFRLQSRAAAFGSWLIALAYGVADEFHQRFVPGRNSSVDDLLADALGAGLLLLLLHFGGAWKRGAGRERS